ncbi:hypothetical protein J2S55_008550 [Streptosporangium brasiliense]|uniref:Uncharacterized protein n=1 Tax=Streptosporangium brasiliense TaxID=47480 RepID=A0ABT9RKL9_9ACTN|nr:hypothetical protein [Streptosporangium brasiliense]
MAGGSDISDGGKDRLVARPAQEFQLRSGTTDELRMVSIKGTSTGHS